MKKILLLLSMALGFIWCGASAENFTYEQSFDNPDDFPDEAVLPSGWKSGGTYPFKRGLASKFGASANSGSYVFGTGSSYNTRDEVFYTQALKLKGGTSCTVRFMLWAPGGTPAVVRNNGVKVTAGNAQEQSAQTIAVGEVPAAAVPEWTSYSFTFTPDADGEYYIAFAVVTSVPSCGSVLFDDIVVSGESPDGGVSPEEKYVVSVPYTQNFDNEDGEYDGTSYLPKGWLTTGHAPFFTASYTDLPAVSGTYYMLTNESDEPRNEYVYTPYFELVGGKKYAVDFYLCMPGGTTTGSTQFTDLEVTAGTGQSVEDQTIPILKVTGESVGQWTRYTGYFTPETDGLYCLAMALESKAAASGYVAVDNFEFKEADTSALKADFTVNAWFDIRDSRLVVIENEPQKMVNLSENATAYEWVVEGAEPSMSEEAEPSFTFPTEGTYTIALTAKNGEQQKTTYKEVKVEHVGADTEGQLPLVSYNIADDKVLWNYSQVPTFKTDITYDFAAGLNHYYRRFAERFALPEGVEFEIATINSYLVAYNRKPAFTPEERNNPFTIAMYGETDGVPDERKVFGKKVSTVIDEFGESGIGLDRPKPQDFSLGENPIKVKGTFYISFEFDDNMSIDSDDPNIPRSYLSLAMMRHKSGSTTFYAKPTAGPEGFKPDGAWHRADDMSGDLSGYGLYLVLWGTLGDAATDIVAIGPDGGIAFAARVQDGELQVSGTQSGEAVSVYDISGKLVKTADATDRLTRIPLSDMGKGTYVVKAGHNTCKVVL